MLHPQDKLDAGDEVKIVWHDLIEAKGRALQGQTMLMVP